MSDSRPLAVHVVTRGGLAVAERLGSALGAGIRVAASLSAFAPADAVTFPFPMREALASVFTRYRGHIFVMAIGAVVRLLAPLLVSKKEDPAVVCVDEAGRFAVSVLSGHEGGANALTQEVAAALGAQPVITTASEVLNALQVDQLGRCPPKSVVLGLGCDRDTPPELLARGVKVILARHQLSLTSVGALATIDLKGDEPALRTLAEQLGCTLRLFSAAELDAAAGVESFSPTVQRHVGTRAVAEPAALLASGARRLLVPKQIYTEPGAGRSMTLAVARVEYSPGTHCRQGSGTLAVVGIGPGALEQMTAAARAAIASAEVVVGYRTYLDLLGPLLAGKEVVSGRMTAEIARAREAVARAQQGARVALISSGDAGVYGMASLTLELLHAAGWRRGRSPQLEIVPGVTAMSAAASLTGAPLGHDFCALSLSDLLTPWPVIAQRLEAAAAADFVIALYNPASTRRRRPLAQACDILRRHRPGSTPVAVVTDAYRSGQHCTISILDRLLEAEIGMTSTVLVGSSRSYTFEDVLVTPRGYSTQDEWSDTPEAEEEQP